MRNALCTELMGDPIIRFSGRPSAHHQKAMRGTMWFAVRRGKHTTRRKTFKTNIRPISPYRSFLNDCSCSITGGAPSRGPLLNARTRAPLTGSFSTTANRGIIETIAAAAVTQAALLLPVSLAIGIYVDKQCRKGWREGAPAAPSKRQATRVRGGRHLPTIRRECVWVCDRNAKRLVLGVGLSPCGRRRPELRQT